MVDRRRQGVGAPQGNDSNIGPIDGKWRKERWGGVALSWLHQSSPEVAMMQSSPANQKRAFQIHAFAFIPSMIFLAILNYVLGEPYWVIWTLLGWGVGLLAHWWFVLGPGVAK